MRAAASRSAATASTSASRTASPPLAADLSRGRRTAAGPVVGATRLTQSRLGAADDIDDRLRLRMRFDEFIALRRHQLAERLAIAGDDFDAFLFQRIERLLFGLEPPHPGVGRRLRPPGPGVVA